VKPRPSARSAGPLRPGTATLAAAAAGLALLVGLTLLGACRGRTLRSGIAPEAAGDPSARVDDLFARFAETPSPGCAVAVVERGRVVLARGYGLADLEARTPITPRTVFEIASISKQFTAASVLLLAERGRLSLDDDVRRYLPELPRYDATITLRHLIHHTGGLPSYIDLLRLSGKHYQDVTTDADALAALAGEPRLEFRPGTAFKYSDTGYFLLSLVVRRVTGETLREFAAENLFAPLGMSDTQILDDSTRRIPRRAAAYSPATGGGFQREESNWEQTGDGAVNTTVLDLARWDGNFYSGAVGGQALVDAMMTPGSLAGGRPLSYAGGLFLDRFQGLRRVRHAGNWGGYSAELMRLPDRGLSVITLCNVSSADPTGLSERVAELYLQGAGGR
jgi:CubicO group peptidase (beta-lactamase class C family)